jgi:hypothetical protein
MLQRRPLKHVSGTYMSMTPLFFLTFHRAGGVLTASRAGVVNGQASTWREQGGHRRHEQGEQGGRRQRATSRASRAEVINGRASSAQDQGGRRGELWRGSGQRCSGRARGRARVGGYARDRANASRRVRLFFSNAKVSHLGKILFSGTTPLRSAPFEPNTIEMELSRSVPWSSWTKCHIVHS